GWWWPVVIAVLAVLVLLALWWLVATLRRRRPAEVFLDTGDGEGATVRGRALEDAPVGGAGLLAGGHQGPARPSGRRDRPAAPGRLLRDPAVAPGPALAARPAGALPHARGSAGLQALPCEVRLRAVKHGAERVS